MTKPDFHLPGKNQLVVVGLIGLIGLMGLMGLTGKGGNAPGIGPDFTDVTLAS